jgi:hypothetical protein
LNTLVKRHISSVVSQSLSKALATLEHDASELISAGMVTLNAKFVGLEDDKLLGRVVEIWGFFWDQVLPYVEGVSGFAYCYCLVINFGVSCYRFFFLFKQTPLFLLSTEHPKPIATLHRLARIPRDRIAQSKFQHTTLTFARSHSSLFGIKSLFRFLPVYTPGFRCHIGKIIFPKTLVTSPGYSRCSSLLYYF